MEQLSKVSKLTNCYISTEEITKIILDKINYLRLAEGLEKLSDKEYEVYLDNLSKDLIDNHHTFLNILANTYAREFYTKVLTTSSTLDFTKNTNTIKGEN